MKKVCVNCGKEFISYEPAAKFCSTKCYKSVN